MILEDKNLKSDGRKKPYACLPDQNFLSLTGRE